MKKILVILSILVLSSSIQSCSKNEESFVMEPKTIANIIDESMGYSYLSYALKKTNLTAVLNGTDKYTLLAPSNMAFREFLMENGFDSIDDVPSNLLKQVLLNHVIAGVLEYSNIETGYLKSAATSEASETPLSIYIKQVNMRVTINGVSRITQGNVRGTNGIIHAVNKVIPLPTVVTFAKADQNLTNLLIALTRSDLTFDFTTILGTSVGTSPAPFTVFAPTNQAFMNLLIELGAQSLVDIDEPTLKATLNHHVIVGANALSTDLSENLQLNTLGGAITANITGGATLTDLNDRVSKIISVDIQAINGVVHVIDKVILPN